MLIKTNNGQTGNKLSLASSKNFMFIISYSTSSIHLGSPQWMNCK